MEYHEDACCRGKDPLGEEASTTESWLGARNRRRQDHLSMCKAGVLEQRELDRSPKIDIWQWRARTKNGTHG